jgi:2-polyprenyl-3-methyl-5-hydroxy-6-metoxy-1,4-benzoquinol methylase
VVAVELIEHLQSAIGFLRCVHDLLTDDGMAILTTSNADGLPEFRS